MKLIKDILKFIFFPFVYTFGYIAYLFSGNTPSLAFAAFRFYFVATAGRSNDLATTVISWFKPKYKIDTAKGVLGDLDSNGINDIVQSVEKNGFHVFDIKLTAEQVDTLMNFASTTPVSYLKFEESDFKYSEDKQLFDENRKLSPRWQFTTDQLVVNAEIENLIFDETMLAVANQYLGTKPVLDIITMWWSLPFDQRAEDKAAQMYHFDMDRFKFIKFFFYLNDVGAENGPHCYVRGTHKKIAKKILKDRRIKDDEINQFYDEKDVLELTAPAGSIIAVDTRGLHKGKPLTEGKRLLFQIQFSNSLFGSPYSKVNTSTLSDDSKNKKKKFQRTYQLIG